MLLALCFSELILFYFDQPDFSAIANKIMDQELPQSLHHFNRSLNQACSHYATISQDPQFSEQLREVNKYNNNYIVARKQIKNFENFQDAMEQKGTTSSITKDV